MAGRKDDAEDERRRVEDLIDDEVAATASQEWSSYRRYLINAVQRIERTLEGQDKKYVLRTEFAPVRNFVYALITLVCIAVGGAVLTKIGLQAKGEPNRYGPTTTTVPEAAHP
jgi:hypothetical protein